MAQRLKIPLIYFGHLKFSSGSESLPDVVFAYIHFNIPLTRQTGLAVEMYRMKRLLNFLETHTLLIQQKITEKVDLYTSDTYMKKVTVSKSWTMITLEKEIKKSSIIIQK